MSDFDDLNEAPTSYTSTTPGTAATSGRKGIVADGAGVGRRKEAVARVRLVPGSGKWSVNGKALDVYFPNKVHQQLVSEPFRTVGAEVHLMLLLESMAVAFLVKLVRYVLALHVHLMKSIAMQIVQVLRRLASLLVMRALLNVRSTA